MERPGVNSSFFKLAQSLIALSCHSQLHTAFLHRTQARVSVKGQGECITAACFPKAQAPSPRRKSHRASAEHSLPASSRQNRVGDPSTHSTASLTAAAAAGNRALRKGSSWTPRSRPGARGARPCSPRAQESWPHHPPTPTNRRAHSPLCKPRAPPRALHFVTRAAGARCGCVAAAVCVCVCSRWEAGGG